MVVAYLEKIKERYYEQRIDAYNRLNGFLTEYKENIEIMKLLDANNDPNFDAFTPRRVNGFHRMKMAELEARQLEVTEQLTLVREEITSLDQEIYEITSVIKVANQNRNVDTSGNEKAKRAILETQENERQRIARELHDSTVQNLTSLVHKVELCSKLVDMDPVRSKLELSSMGNIIRDIIEDARNMIYDLRPMSFDDIGFDITVERFLDKIKLVSGIHIDFAIEGRPYAVDSVVGITLLRVIQEACYNAMKHSEAARIEVIIIYEENHIIVKINDNGKGFVVDYDSNVSREDNSGFGLSMMRERVFLLCGEILIETSEQQGCNITVTVPVSKEDFSAD